MRLSPNESATKYKIGTKKQGNDNNIWIVYKTSNDVKRWKKFKAKVSVPKGKKYYIHDNGGRPYKVIITSKEAYIYECMYTENDKCNYDKLVKKYIIINKYIGKHPKNKYIGNSIILQLSEKKYVYIGHKIYEFSINDNIIKYYSFVGNSDVPYPVLLGEKRVYFMLDMESVDRKHFNEIEKTTKIDWYNAYNLYYGKREIKNNKITKKYIIEPLSKYGKKIKSKLLYEPKY